MKNKEIHGIKDLFISDTISFLIILILLKTEGNQKKYQNKSTINTYSFLEFSNINNYATQYITAYL